MARLNLRKNENILDKQFLVTVKQTSKTKENIMKKTSVSAGKAFKVVGLVFSLGRTDNCT